MKLKSNLEVTLVSITFSLSPVFDTELLTAIVILINQPLLENL
jgi:hypothetical protein